MNFSPRGDSPVKRIPRNAIPSIQKALVAFAAGRCEFPGCNKFLFEHPLTKDRGNYSENAHIVAFALDAARGQDGQRPADINSIDNLMLLCAACHKDIDDNPLRYPREFLVTQKREHEQRVRRMTDLGPELRTNVLLLKSRIGERVVEVGQQEVMDALRPRYPASSSYRTIDLSQLGDETGDGYYPLAVRLIRQQVAEMYAATGAFDTVQLLSVFGLAPIPLLVALGQSLSNTIATDLYQCHRDRPDRWTWHEDGTAVRYVVSKSREGTEPKKVALAISLSGTVNVDALPVGDDVTIYHVTLDGVAVNPGFLRQRSDLAAFREFYRDLIARISGDHPSIRKILLFPAVPAPIAIVAGFDLLPKVHPALVVHDYDKRVGGFTERIKVNPND